MISNSRLFLKKKEGKLERTITFFFSNSFPTSFVSHRISFSLLVGDGACCLCLIDAISWWFFPPLSFLFVFFLSYARLRRPRVDPQLLESLRRKSLVELATLTAYVFQINAIHCFILVVPPSEHSSVSSGNHPSSARHLFFCFFSFTPSSPAVSFPLSREINARRTGEPFLPIPCF